MIARRGGVEIQACHDLCLSSSLILSLGTPVWCGSACSLAARQTCCLPAPMYTTDVLGGALVQASAEDSAAAAPVLPAFPAPTEPPPSPPSSEAVYPRASSSFSLPPKPLFPSQASQLRLIVDEILEFPPDELPDPDTLPESSADDGALQLRARLVGLVRDPRAQSFVSRLRFISAQFQGQKHRFLEILDPFGERRMLMLRVPQPGRFSRAERLRLAQRQASFFVQPRGGFAPGMRIIPANWRKYGASEEDVSIMHSGQPFLLHDLPPPCAAKITIGSGSCRPACSPRTGTFRLKRFRRFLVAGWTSAKSWAFISSRPSSSVPAKTPFSSGGHDRPGGDDGLCGGKEGPGLQRPHLRIFSSG